MKINTLFGLGAALALGVATLTLAPGVAGAQGGPAVTHRGGPAMGPGNFRGNFTARSPGNFRGNFTTRSPGNFRGNFVARGNFHGRFHRFGRFHHFRGGPWFGAYAYAPFAYNSCWRVRWTAWGPQRVWVCGPTYPYEYY